MPGFFGNQTIYMYSICIFIFYTVFISFFTKNISLGSRYLEFSQILIFYFEYKKNVIAKRAGQNRRVILFFIPFLLTSCYLTYNLFLINPEALRWVGKSKAIGYQYMVMGAGGYNLAYFLAMLVPILILILKQDHYLEYRYKVGIIVLISISLYIVFISKFFISLIITLIGFSFLFLPKKVRSYTIILPFSIFAFSLLFFNNILNTFFDFILQFINEKNTGFSSKISELQILLSGSSVIGAYSSARLNAYMYSINAFLEYPLLGAIFSKHGDPFSNVVIYGNHSHFIDTFALFGLGIGLLQLYLYFGPIISKIKRKNNYYDTFFILIGIGLLIALTFNIATVSIGFLIFFILPTVNDYLFSDALDCKID
tara:strand:+ start:589 stop:1695 length:1107 start_codon:yes stop_codon:yes gene_type:complete